MSSYRCLIIYFPNAQICPRINHNLPFFHQLFNMKIELYQCNRVCQFSFKRIYFKITFRCLIFSLLYQKFSFLTYYSYIYRFLILVGKEFFNFLLLFNEKSRLNSPIIVKIDILFVTLRVKSGKIRHFRIFMLQSRNLLRIISLYGAIKQNNSNIRYIYILFLLTIIKK